MTFRDLKGEKKGLGISHKHYKIAASETADCWRVLRTRNQSKKEMHETRGTGTKPLLTFLQCGALQKPETSAAVE